MKKYLDNVPSGNGRYIRIDDIVALQAQINAIEALFDNLPAFVINGCVVSGTAPNNAVSAGLVYLNGKVHTFPAVPTIDLSTTKFIEAVPVSASDSRPLFGGGSANTFDNYIARLVTTVSAGEGIAISQATAAQRYIDVIASKSDLTTAVNNLSFVLNLDLPLESAWEAFFGASFPAKYNKNASGFVQVTGAVRHTGGGSQTIAFLPVNFRPYVLKRLPLVGNSGGGTLINFMAEIIPATGAINLLQSVNTNDVVYLDNISFYTTM